jgi:hypothetical protein
MGAERPKRVPGVGIVVPGVGIVTALLIGEAQVEGRSVEATEPLRF